MKVVFQLDTTAAATVCSNWFLAPVAMASCSTQMPLTVSDLHAQSTISLETVPTPLQRLGASPTILVVDDNEGLNSLFELAPDGRVLSVTPLSGYGRDAEGVALQPETGALYVGFDGGRALAIFDWVPSEVTIDTPLERGPDCATS